MIQIQVIKKIDSGRKNDALVDKLMFLILTNVLKVPNINFI